MSVSKLFSDFVDEVTIKEPKEDSLLLQKIKKIEISEEIKALTGILKGRVPDDFDYKDAKYEYLKEKYGL